MATKAVLALFIAAALAKTALNIAGVPDDEIGGRVFHAVGWEATR